jgi:starch-binding outer membrane protein, SusD/RagB family
MKFNKIFQTLSIVSVLALGSCTDLVNKETDSIISGGGNAPPIPAADLLKSVYGSFENYTDQQGTYALGQHTSAEMIPPTRGVDWGDNGVWRTLDQHTWDATHSWVTNSWNDLNLASYRCNEVIAAAGVTPAQAGEAKFFRAFFMWHIMDFWGQVPIRQTSEGVKDNPKVMTRSEAYDFIMADLTAALAVLPKKGPGVKNIEPSKAAANFMIARMLLNKSIYKGAAAANADMDGIITAVDAITADGYAYEPKYFDLWNPKAATTESILVTDKGIGPQRRWCMTTHYSQETGGWNGFATLADFYDKFDAADGRRYLAAKKDNSALASGIDYGFLIGQQINKDGTQTIDSRTKKPLSFTRDITLAGTPTDKGIRAIKYHPVTSDNSFFLIARYGEAMMMKMEAQVRKGDAAGALTTLTALRAARKAPAPSASPTLDGVFDEWGRELYWEGHKRTTEIRHGKFLTGTGVDKKDPTTVLFPIPASAVVANPNLKQNAGY